MVDGAKHARAEAARAGGRPSSPISTATATATATAIGIAVLLTVAAAYAWPAAGLLRALPKLAPVLITIAAIYLLRGFALLPELPLIAFSPTTLPAQELAFSAFALATGLLHAAGLRGNPSLLPERIQRRLAPRKKARHPG